LKNYLFSRAGKRIDEVQQKWTSMLAVLEAADSEEIVVTYIRHFWSSNYGVTREKDLYTKIKDRVNSTQHAINLADDLSRNARLYSAMINTDSDLWNQYGSTAREHMNSLNLLGMIQIRPLVLAALDKFTVKEVQKSLKLMVSWAVRFLIVGSGGSGTLESLYSQRAEEVRKDVITTTAQLLGAMIGSVPANSQFQSAFAVATISKNSIARYYLRVLDKEFDISRDPSLIVTSNEEVVNLEHILPQHPSGAWSYINADDINNYCNRIGNLALLQTKINAVVGNDGFKEKLPSYKTSPFSLTSALDKYQSWDMTSIEERQRELAELAVKAWPNKVQ
jgi:hypothetical protein